MNATEKPALAQAEKIYNPTADVFHALRAFDRPVDAHQLGKALPKMPEGTVSGSLFRLKKAGVVERNVGTRPALWRAVKKELPAEFAEGRMHKPMQPGLQRARGSATQKKPLGKELLIVVPLGKKDTATMTESEARQLLAALRRMFGE